MSSYICLVKLGYTPLVNSYDEVQPGNIGALKKGLEALLSEDARDNARANELWAEARELMAEDSEDEVGPAGEGKITVEDDFFQDRSGYGYGYGFGSLEYGGLGGW